MRMLRIAQRTFERVPIQSAIHLHGSIALRRLIIGQRQQAFTIRGGEDRTAVHTNRPLEYALACPYIGPIHLFAKVRPMW